MARQAHWYGNTRFIVSASTLAGSGLWLIVNHVIGG